jgi:N-methylhydantoinase B
MPMQSYMMRAGDCFQHISAAGGGFGPAIERAPEAVAADVADGLVSPAGAARDYGVALDPAPGRVDWAATRTLRNMTNGGERVA